MEIDQLLWKFTRAVILAWIYVITSSLIKQEVFHVHDVPLIVDESHRAQFKFHSSFPNTTLEQGEDIMFFSIVIYKEKGNKNMHIINIISYMFLYRWINWVNISKYTKGH